MRTSGTVQHRKSTKARGTPSRAGTKDALALLKEDHRKVEELFASFEKGRGQNKEKIAREIVALLKVHAMIEEEVFYPAVREVIEDDEIMDEAQIEHNSAKQLIAEIEAGPDGEMWEAKVKVLSEYIKHHVKEEEGEMFKQIRAGELDLDELGQEMMARKQVLMDRMGLKGGNARV